jgi:hypothetical protein
VEDFPEGFWSAEGFGLIIRTAQSPFT